MKSKKTLGRYRLTVGEQLARLRDTRKKPKRNSRSAARKRIRRLKLR